MTPRAPYWNADLDEAVLAAASEAQIASWRGELALCEFVFYAEEYLELAAPGLDPSVRADFARYVAGAAEPHETAEHACRRLAREGERTAAKEELKAAMLEPAWSRNDVGNAERFALANAERYKYLEDRGIWRRWDGKRWRDSPETEVMRTAKNTVKRMLQDALRRTGPEADEDQKWAFTSMQSKGVSAMVRLAASEKIFASTMKDYDRNKDLITVENGVVDLKTGEIRPHCREDMMTTLSKVKYDQTARAPRWEQFLVEIFNGDTELVDFVHRAVGYSMTGHTREQAFFILHGGGRNGKGRFIKQLMNVVGDLARTTSFRTFTVAGGQADSSGNTPALAELAGIRLVTVGEPDQGVRLSESTIKSLTGEDEIPVCRKHEHPFTYIPICKIWIHCNHKPVIRGTDEGIWERPRLIPFNVSFMAKEDAAHKGIVEEMRRDPDKKLDEKLAAERAGIFAWAVRGAMKWYVQGLGKCKVVDEATESYRTESDQLAPFIEERLRQETGKFSTNAEVFEAYTQWCRANLIEYPMAGQTLSKHLVRHGFARGKNSSDVRGFKDTALVKTPGLFAVK